MEFFCSFYLKSLLVLIGTTFLCSSLACTDDSWQLYKTHFNKMYNDLNEDVRRRAIFCENLEMIHEHNVKYIHGEVTFEMSVNRFADWTHEEFLHWLTGAQDLQHRWQW